VNAPNKESKCDNNDTKASSNPPPLNAPLKDPNWWLVGIALLTSGVIGWQSWETRKASEASLEQAHISSMVYVSTFRPCVHIRKMRLVWDGESYSLVRVAIYFVNTGQGKASITGGQITLNRIFSYKPNERDWVSHVAIRPFDLVSGATRDAEISHGQIASFCKNAQLEADRTGRQDSWLQCAGRIEYVDGNGTQRTTGFCRRYDLSMQRFVVSDSDAEDDYED
jgi:hypothetical protein